MPAVVSGHTTFIFSLTFLLHSHPSFPITCQINSALHENTESGSWKAVLVFFFSLRDIRHKSEDISLPGCFQEKDLVVFTNAVAMDRSDKAKSPEGHVLDGRDSSQCTASIRLMLQ